MSQSAHIHNLVFALLSGLVLCTSQGCDNSKAPPAPTASAQQDTATTEDGGDDSSSLGTGDTTDSSDSTSDGTDDSATGGATGTAGGAQIGTDEDKSNVKQCLDANHFFDRFANNGDGTCTTLPLAKMDCTADGIKAVLTASQKTDYDTKMTTDYKDWILDQCLDCPPGGSAPQCKSTKGEAQTGTKVFFVKEEANEIHGKAMVLPERPGAT